MFITKAAFKFRTANPFLNDLGDEAWRGVELALQSPWFVVTLRQFESIDGEEEQFQRLRTVLVSNVADVQKLAEQAKAVSLMQFESAQIVTPGWLNDTGTWKMELVSAVWVADETAAPGKSVDICETSSGARYVTPMCATEIDELENVRLRYRFDA